MPRGRIQKSLAQPLIDLHDVHMGHAFGQILRQHSHAAADLEDDIGSIERGGALDDAEDVGVDQKVLPQLAVGLHGELAYPSQAGLDGGVGHDAHPQPNRRSALRETVSPSSVGATPRNSARKATVWATNAGWFALLAHDLR